MKRKKGVASKRAVLVDLAQGRRPTAERAVPGTVRLGIYVPDPWRMRVKIEAAKRRTTISALIIEAVNKMLG